MSDDKSVVVVDADKRYQRAVAYHLLTNLKKLKEIELAMSRHAVASMDLTVPPDQVLIGLDKIGHALRALGAELRLNAGSTPLATTLYRRVKGDTQFGDWHVSQWVTGIIQKHNARKQRERIAAKQAEMARHNNDGS